MDEATYIAVSEQWMASFFRTAYSILKNRHDAEDAVQQMLLKAWQAREKGRAGAERAWMMRILINECCSMRRHLCRSIPTENAAVLEDTAADAEETGLHEAISALPDPLRTPFLLKYMEGMTEKETAIALGLSVPAVKNRLFRARKALQKQLKEEVSL